VILHKVSGDKKKVPRNEIATQKPRRLKGGSSRIEARMEKAGTTTLRATNDLEQTIGGSKYPDNAFSHPAIVQASMIHQNARETMHSSQLDHIQEANKRANIQ